MVMLRAPLDLNSAKDVDKANRIVNNVQYYVKTLSELIANPNLRACLNQLESYPDEELRLEAHQIETLFKDLEHTTHQLILYIEELREVIKHRPQEWRKVGDQLVLMIDQKFGGERGELRKEFGAVLHKEADLRALITCEEHLAEFLK